MNHCLRLTGSHRRSTARARSGPSYHNSTTRRVQLQLFHYDNLRESSEVMYAYRCAANSHTPTVQPRVSPSPEASPGHAPSFMPAGPVRAGPHRSIRLGSLGGLGLGFPTVNTAMQASPGLDAALQRVATCASLWTMHTAAATRFMPAGPVRAGPQRSIR